MRRSKQNHMSAFLTADFRCKDRRSCVSKSLVCDGRAHCHDGSDELDCPAVAPAAPQTYGLKCRKGSKACRDGRQCVLHSHVCDGEPDCEDGSDEEGCQQACKEGEGTLSGCPVYTLEISRRRGLFWQGAQQENNVDSNSRPTCSNWLTHSNCTLCSPVSHFLFFSTTTVFNYF